MRLWLRLGRNRFTDRNGRPEIPGTQTSSLLDIPPVLPQQRLREVRVTACIGFRTLPGVTMNIMWGELCICTDQHTYGRRQLESHHGVDSWPRDDGFWVSSHQRRAQRDGRPFPVCGHDTECFSRSVPHCRRGNRLGDDRERGRHSGHEATKEIKRLHPNTKVIIVSSHSGDVYRKAAPESSAGDYIEKSLFKAALDKELSQRLRVAT